MITQPPVKTLKHTQILPSKGFVCRGYNETLVYAELEDCVMVYNKETDILQVIDLDGEIIDGMTPCGTITGIAYKMIYLSWLHQTDKN